MAGRTIFGHRRGRVVDRKGPGRVTTGKDRPRRNWAAAVLLALLLPAALLVPAGCGERPGESSLEKITVSLDWTPNTNHSGLFAAKDLGFYREEGLEVEIVQLTGVEQLVAAGRCHFGVSYQEAVTFARLENIPVVSIAAIIQHNTSGFASLKEKGIISPADFAGKRYGGWGSPVEEATIRAVMEMAGADYGTVEILTTGAVDFFAASEKDADFSWIFFGWDGVAAEIRGIGLNYIPLAEYHPALDYYTPVLIAGEDLVRGNPDLVKRFMRATARGYRVCRDDPAEAARILLQNAPELDRDLVYASQDWLADKFQAGAPAWGLQDRAVWERYARWLFEQGLVAKIPEVDGAFTNEFLPQK